MSEKIKNEKSVRLKALDKEEFGDIESILFILRRRSELAQFRIMSYVRGRLAELDIMEETGNE